MELVGAMRVGSRMAGAVILTGGELAWLRARRRVSGDCPHTAVRHGRRWARALLRLLGVELEVSGRPPEGPALLLANHRSYLDIPILLSQVPCTFLAKAEIGSWPMFGKAAQLTRTVLVQRDCKESRRASRAAAIERIRQGLSFAAFPEGTTSHGPEVLPFHLGLFEVAAEHGVPVVPVTLYYRQRSAAWVSEPLLPHFRRCFSRRRVQASVHFGPTLRSADGREMCRQAEAWVRSRLAALGPPEADAPLTLPPAHIPTAARSAA